MLSGSNSKIFSISIHAPHSPSPCSSNYHIPITWAINLSSSLMSSPSTSFRVMCTVHATVAVTCGVLMMFYLNEISAFGHGEETAIKLQGSTPHDQLLIQTSDSLSGMLLVVIGVFLLMVSSVRDKDFQTFFAKGCVLIHVSMAVWRIYFERRLEDLAWDWPRQAAGDIILGLSWVLFLVHSWKEKYDWSTSEEDERALLL